jgi:HEAT repeat protein
MGIFQRIFGLDTDKVHEMRKRRDIKGLLRALNYRKDFFVRVAAAHVLKDVGDRHAVQALARVLEDNASWVERNIAPYWGMKVPYCLGEIVTNAIIAIAGRESIGPLVLPLSHDSPKVRAACARILGVTHDPAASEALAHLLHDTYGDVLVEAIKALGAISDERGIESLIAAAINPDFPQREEAIKVLGQTRNPRAISSLIALLDDSSASIRMIAAKVLGQTRNPRAIPSLIALLDDSSASIRMIAAEGLQESNWKPRDKNERAKFYYAIQAWVSLAHIGDPRAVEGVNSLVRNLWETKWFSSTDGDIGVQSRKYERSLDSVISALGIVGDPAVVPLINMFYAGYNFVGAGDYDDIYSSNRTAINRIAKALVAIGKPAVDPLIKVLSDRCPWRSEAARALGHIGDKSALSALKEALHDEEDITREAAKEAIEMIMKGE